MALSSGTIKALFKEISSTFTTLKDIDYKHLTVKDVVIIAGSFVTIGKSLHVMWQIYAAVKEYGIARMMKPNFKKYGSWAIVTGCTSGIGQAYATELAASGINIVLISRQLDKLKDFAAFLEKEFHVETETICVDLSEGKPVYAEIKKQIDSKEIGVLVNNVGIMYDYPEYFADVPEEKIWDLINVNVGAATIITHMVLPEMVKRKNGAIVIISSGTSYLPTPLMTVYSATKTYLDSFSKNLVYEYGSQGITIQCLTPLCISRGADGAQMSSFNKATSVQPTAESYAHTAVRTLGWTNRTTGHLSHTVQSWMAGLIPESFIIWAAKMSNVGAQKRAKQLL